MENGRIVYNSETGRIELDRFASRAYDLPDGFENWWVIGRVCSETHFAQYLILWGSVENINDFRKDHQKKILSVEQVAKIWSMLPYIDTEIAEANVLK